MGWSFVAAWFSWWYRLVACRRWPMTKRKNKAKTKREDILRIIERDGPADAQCIADALSACRFNIHQLMKRMAVDGQLATFKNAPRTCITTTDGE
jgi:hypothetical protein